MWAAAALHHPTLCALTCKQAHRAGHAPRLGQRSILLPCPARCDHPASGLQLMCTIQRPRSRGRGRRSAACAAKNAAQAAGVGKAGRYAALPNGGGDVGWRQLHCQRRTSPCELAQCSEHACQ